MAVDIVKMLKSVNEGYSAFKQHPGKNLSEADKVHYINGLALLANSDDKITYEEEAYLESLIKAFELSADKFDECVEFAEEPNEQEITQIKEAFEDSDIKYVFIVDAIFIAHSDSKMHTNEVKVIDQFFTMFGITKKEGVVLRKLHTKLDKAESIYNLFKDRTHIKKELFSYLMEYEQQKANVEMCIILKSSELLFFKKQPHKRWNLLHFDGEESFNLASHDIEQSIVAFKEALLDKLNLTYFESYSVRVLYSRHSKIILKIFLDHFFDENCKGLFVEQLEKFYKEGETFTVEALYSAFPDERPKPRPKAQPKPKAKLKQHPKGFRFRAIVDKNTTNVLPKFAEATVEEISSLITITVFVEDGIKIILTPKSKSQNGQKYAEDVFKEGQKVGVFKDNNAVFVETKLN